MILFVWSAPSYITLKTFICLICDTVEIIIQQISNICAKFPTYVHHFICALVYIYVENLDSDLLQATVSHMKFFAVQLYYSINGFTPTTYFKLLYYIILSPLRHPSVMHVIITDVQLFLLPQQLVIASQLYVYWLPS